MLRAILALDDGLEVTLLLPPGVAGPIVHPRLRVERARFAPRPAAVRAAREGRAVRAAASAWRADVVVHESFPVPSTRGVPLVLTVHDLRALDREGRSPSLGRRMVAPLTIRRGLARASRVVAVSEFTRDAVLRAGRVDPERVVVVPNAADHLVPRPSAPTRHENQVLCVGHLDRRKGSDVLLEAFALVHRRRPRASLRFAGAGPLAGSLFARASALGLGRAVSIAPARTDAELASLFAAATLVAVPSRYEGFCIPMLEAMRCGAPVVAADASALPEVAGGAARLVRGFEPAAWADAILETLGDEGARARLAAAGKARAARFTWRGAGRRLLAVLREAAADRR